jgi:hypothetical protein
MSFINRFFRRNDEESDELSIYKDGPASNKLASLLFGVFALFVTLLVAGGLFFGGRAVYRALSGSPVEETTKQQEENADTAEKSPASKAADSSEPSSGESQPQAQQSPDTGDTPGNVPTTVPETGDSPSQQALPRTGDAGL